MILLLLIILFTPHPTLKKCEGKWLMQELDRKTGKGKGVKAECRLWNDSNGLLMAGYDNIGNESKPQLVDLDSMQIGPKGWNWSHSNNALDTSFDKQTIKLKLITERRSWVFEGSNRAKYTYWYSSVAIDSSGNSDYSDYNFFGFTAICTRQKQH